MNDVAIPTSSLIPLPASREAIAIRPGAPEDVAFIDALQSKTTKQVGWMPRKQIEGKIALGHVLVAWTSRPCSGEDMGETPMVRGERIGYVIGNDQYFKRDDVGIIYALNVVLGSQRKLIGATLIKAMFERAAWGCRLFCCWCAQDIAANYFWESIGFVPIAFRAGSRDKGRVHIFWQKRIREGDTTTPYWFPCQTSGGSIREDRLVLPIPPGTNWQDAKPIVLPENTSGSNAVSALPGPTPRIRQKKEKTLALSRPEPKSIHRGGLQYPPPKPVKVESSKPRRQPKPKVKNDPKYVAAARELRDRWMEAVGSGQLVIESGGKYEVARRIEPPRAALALPAAA